MTTHSFLFPATLAFAFGLAGAISAQGVDEDIDTDGDGFYSFEEMSLAYPEITAEVFASLDTTGDGLLDQTEEASAAAAGAFVGTDN